MELVSIHETYHVIVYHIIVMSIGGLQFRIYFNNFETALFRRVAQNFMFDFKSQVVPNKGFLHFSISSIKCFDSEVINGTYTILDITNVLKIIIFPSNVIFLILHKFKRFCILVIFFPKFTCKYYKQEHLKARAKVKNDQFSCFKFIPFWNESFLELFFFNFTWKTNTLTKNSNNFAHFQIIIKIYLWFCSNFFSII